MGENLISTLLIALGLFVGIDFFVDWYRQFLQRRRLPPTYQRSILQIMWVLLALLLWNALYRKFMPASFDGSHLLFALFIFSLRGMLLAFMGRS